MADDSSIHSSINSSISSLNPNDIISIKLPSNKTTPNLRTKLAMKSFELDKFRNLCALRKLELVSAKKITHLHALVYHLQS